MIRKNLAQTIEGLVDKEVKSSGLGRSFNRSELLFMCGGLGAIIDQWIDDECQKPVASVITTIDSLVGRYLRR